MRSSRVILLVEPDEGIRVTFQVVLRREGYVVLEATNAADALEQIREAEPELVITGMRAPEGSGEKLIRTLRSEPANGLSILALGPDTIREEAVDAGADAFQAEPLTAEQLIRAVTSLIGRA